MRQSPRSRGQAPLCGPTRPAVVGVTGVAGFIGSHLAEALVRLGHRVVGVDDLSDGSLANVATLLDRECFSMVEADVGRPEVADALLRSTDVVVHLAAAVGVERTMRDPFGTLSTNIRTTMTLLEAARDGALRRGGRGASRIVVVSSSEAYGKAEGAPFHESQDVVLGGPQRTRWAYGAGKLVGEFLALAAHAQHGVSAVVVRPFNTVGPRQSSRHGMVVPRMMEQALSGAPITVFGTGEQTRCFCAVQDTARALVGLALDERAVGGVFNVGGEQEITIADLAREIRKVAGSASEIVHVPYDDAYGAGFDDMRRRAPDTRRIRALLGWRPTVSLRRILEEVRDHLAGRPTALGVGAPEA